ncbi:PEP-CTERM sorting domain-containing protein [Rugamonas sp.]|uniref:PEP-CTERM sorting domain-containing protein n=1 Tax=Rugamonas sp. TaxID=1926287 RepID=UPI0025F025EF|nr:PEP-CTERM sorting domain-containing protein [Rugamonas sp.]
MKNLILALGVTALLSGNAFAADELIVNGSFEAPALANGTWSNYDSITGWTGIDHGIEVRNNVEGSTPFGVNFVELDTSQNSGMYQNVATSYGQKYTLSFDFSDRPRVALDSQGLDVYWGVSKVGHVDNASGWTQFTVSDLVGAAGSTKLSFYATGTSDGLGTSLDNVSLTAAVPEPETYGMMLAGLGLLGLVARRKGANKA